MKHLKQIMIVLGAVSMLTACISTKQTAVKAEGKGETHVYETTFQQMWDAIPSIVAPRGTLFHVIETNSAAGYYAISSTTAGGVVFGALLTADYGDVGAIYVKRTASTNQTSIEVVIKQRNNSLVSNVSGKRKNEQDFERIVHQMVADKYKLVN
jgi:hypothetical protein